MKILLLGMIMSCASYAQNYQYIQGYQRQDGTYVQGYYRTQADNYEGNNIRPDYSPSNNYGIHPNHNHNNHYQHSNIVPQQRWRQ